MGLKPSRRGCIEGYAPGYAPTATSTPPAAIGRDRRINGPFPVSAGLGPVGRGRATWPSSYRVSGVQVEAIKTRNDDRNLYQKKDGKGHGQHVLHLGKRRETLIDTDQAAEQKGQRTGNRIGRRHQRRRLAKELVLASRWVRPRSMHSARNTAPLSHGLGKACDSLDLHPDIMRLKQPVRLQQKVSQQPPAVHHPHTAPAAIERHPVQDRRKRDVQLSAAPLVELVKNVLILHRNVANRVSLASSSRGDTRNLASEDKVKFWATSLIRHAVQAAQPCTVV